MIELIKRENSLGGPDLIRHKSSKEGIGHPEMWRLQVADRKENCKTVYISVLGMKHQVGLRLPSLSPETGF